MPELLAKLTPPRIRNVFERDRLFIKLDQARESYASIWVDSPAGSGKTTMVASYLQSRKLQPVWYQVDEGDADIASFFYYLTQGVKHHVSRKSKLPLLTSEYQQGIPAFTRIYFRELFSQLKDDNVLVFDNVQDAGVETGILQLLQYICAEIPTNGKVIFISRSQIPENLTRFHTNQEMGNISWNDLQLTLAEGEGIANILLQNNQKAKPEKIKRLCKYTEGWTTGFILFLRQFEAGGELTEKDQFDSTQILELSYQEHMFDYFAGELFNRLKGSHKQILIRAVFLGKLTIKSVNKLTGTEQAKSVLTTLEKDNFFITRKGLVNNVYEFHPLFKTFLLLKAEELLSQPEIIELKYQAANILLEVGDFDSAAKLYIDTQQWPELKRILLEHAEELEQQGRHDLLKQWLDFLPTDEYINNAELLYWRGIASLHFDPFFSYEELSKAYVLFEKENNGKWLYQAWLAISDSIFLKHDHFCDAMSWIDKLHVLREKYPSYPSIEIQARVTIGAYNLAQFAGPNTDQFKHWLKETENIFTYTSSVEAKCISGSRLSVYYAFFGKLDKLLHLADNILKYVDSEKIRPIIRIFALWSEITASWMSGKPTETDNYTQKAIELGKEYGVHITEEWVVSAATYSNLVYSKLDKAKPFLDKFADMADPKQRFSYNHYFYLLGWYEAARKNYAIAHEHIQTAYDMSLDLCLPVIKLLNQIGLATSLVLQENYEQAYSHAEVIWQESLAVGNTHFAEYRTNILLAWIGYRKGDFESAKDKLSMAFEYGEKTGYVAGSWWLNEMITELADFALRESIHVEYTKKFIRLYNLEPLSRDNIPDEWPFKIKIYSLGRFCLLINGVPVTSDRKTSKKTLDLLKAILSFGGKNVSGEKLANVLWPDQDGDKASGNFRTALHRLRKLLGHEAVIYNNGLITLDPALFWVDIWSTERSLNKIHSATQSIEKEKSVNILRNVLKQYQGPFLHHDDESSWSLTVRERLHQKLTYAISIVGQYLEAIKNQEEALSLYQNALDIDDLNEGFYQGIMRCCIELDKAAEGIAAYQRSRTTLSKKLNVALSQETEELRKQLQTKI